MISESHSRSNYILHESPSLVPRPQNKATKAPTSDLTLILGLDSS